MLQKRSESARERRIALYKSDDDDDDDDDEEEEEEEDVELKAWSRSPYSPACFAHSRVFVLCHSAYYLGERYRHQQSETRMTASVLKQDPGLTFCADSNFGIRSTPVLPQ